MSFNINSDKEFVRGSQPKLIGDNELTIRSGTGSLEKEILRAQLDSNTGLPRVGINRTGQRVDTIKITAGGSGYTSAPSVTISPPAAGGVQALASAFIFNGEVTTIAVNNPGSGYTSAPTVTFSGGGGVGAAATATLDTVDFELDISGAIRTSTSIISDTARILNLDVDNLISPDLNHRAPNLKTYANATGTLWSASVFLQKDSYRYFGSNIYQVTVSGTTGADAPTHTDGEAVNGTATLKHIGFRVDDNEAFGYGTTGESGVYPRSITPVLGDRSDKIATTEYVLNLATNDVGGRIYVSQQIGSDQNDGRSAVNPVRTIKKAAQLAWATPGVKETLIVSGGDYVEDNPISLPPDCSIVGDNLRLVIMRPANPGKHMVKFGDKNYVIGVTFRDQIDSNGDAVSTWDFAMVFDDKQRVIIDNEVNGDFGVDFPIGHQIFGPDKFNVDFQQNTGLSALTSGLEVVGVNTGARAKISNVTFETTTGASAFINGSVDVLLTSGSFVEGERFDYIVSGSQGSQINTQTITATAGTNTLIFSTNPTGDSIIPGSYIFLDDTADANFTQGFYEVATIDDTNAPTSYEVTVVPILNSPSWETNQAASINIFQAAIVTESFDSTSIKSIRAEGEVVSVDEDVTSTLPIQRIDFSLQGDPSIATGGFQNAQFGNAEDLGGIVFYTNQLVGRDNIHDFKEGQEIEISGLPTLNPDLSFLMGKQRIYKVLEDADGRSRRFVIPKKAPTINDSNFDPGQTAVVKSYSKSVTLTLLNSPNEFSLSTPVERRFQDACVFLRNNRDFIADEVVGRINDQFKKEYYSVYNVSGTSFDIFLGTLDHENTYDSANPTGTATFGGVTANVTNFVYDTAVTGVATVTTDVSLNLSEDDTVQLAGLEISCDAGTKVYPSYSSPTVTNSTTNGDEQCRQDVRHFINAIVRDLEFGSNHNIIEAAQKYIVGAKIAYIENEIIQTVRAIEYARELAILAMRNWRTGDGTPGNPAYTPVYSSVPRYFDDSVITSTAGTPACDDVRSAIDTLAYLYVDVIANDASGTYLDAAYLIARNRDLIADQALINTEAQFPSLGLSDIHQRKCRRDINYILGGLIRDLVLGGNSGIVTNAETYFTGTALTGIDASQIEETRYAYTQVRDLAIAAMRGWKDGTGAAVTTSSPIPQFVDATILADPLGNPLCANVEASITTSMGILDGILEYAEDPASGTAIEPGTTTKTTGTLFDTTNVITYPDSYIYDANNQRMAIRGDFDDYPIIEASPYTQNSSIISFLGGSGALVDGSKVKQPNCPFPGLELDGSATFPNQGKSMVASAFTIVSFGGTGYKIIEDGYTQLVSVFVIFCADGILAESGGYASVTNSATNFGQFALRGRGFRREAYTFDVGTIVNVSATPTGRTIFTVDNLGREPLEHYVVKVDGHSNVSSTVEYFIDEVSGVTVGPPFSATITIDDGTGQPYSVIRDSDGTSQTAASLLGETIRLHRPSIVNSSSHTWEFAGSGTNYLALPENGGTKVEANEQVSEDYGRVYVSGTDELGDFKVGTFAQIENRTGAITFTGTVTISEVEFLKLKGGDVVVTGFDASNTLGGANATDSKLPTQKAVKDYITNNLGPYINKPYSTNAVPRALVELTDSGKISIDQIPALRPFEVYTVANQQERTSIEGALAGDIAIQQDTTTSFILNNDLDSLFLAFGVDPTIQFTIGDIFLGSISQGRIQATEYRQGVVHTINITDGGSGYTSPPTVTIAGGNPQQGAISAAATCTIANGEVVTVTIVEFNGLKGGKGYTTAPTVTFSAPAGSGTQATGVALIESRLYGNIVNNIAITDTDTIDSSDIPAVTINLTRVVNTSSFDSNNWVSLTSSTIDGSTLIGGPIPANVIATGGTANSFTFLRGDQNWALAVQSVKSTETRYFAKLSSQASSGSSELQFTTNSDVLVGHEVVANVTGIQANTNIDGVLTSGGFTTISLSNTLTSTIPVNTVIEFDRGSSPITFESSYTQGGFVDSIVIANGGSGFTNGQYFDQQLLGGTGTGLRANITVANNAISDIVVTDGGVGFTADFNITTLPTATIGAGSNAVLAAKISTVNKQYANVAIDVQRVTDLTVSADLFGTIGVARFKKSQFDIGTEGNGSVTLKTGADSGLDADLLDGAQGAFYLNSTNQNSGTLPTDRLSGTYNISISGSSANTIRLITGTNNPTSNPSPNNFVEGIIANTINNSANGLNDGGSKNLVMTIRNGGSGFDASFGGVRQLAFTDNDNMYLRGSGTGVTAFGSWGKIWSSLNDGPGSDLDADKLDNRQGIWYQNALNVNYGTLSDERLPRFISASSFRDDLTIKSFNGDPRYQIYVSGLVLGSTPFTPGNSVNLYNSNSQNVGEITIDNLIVNDDTVDNFNDYTIIVGRLTTGNFIGAETIGSASNRVPFQDFSIEDGNTIDVAVLESDSGTANLRLGRKDGVSSAPGIYFNSSQLAANYNVAMIASGGNGTDGSGTLNVQVVNADGMTINGNQIWNAGNIQFQTTNVPNTAVLRDANGDIAVGAITGNVTGAASLNVLKAGDTMTGSLTLTGAGSNLSVSGTSTLTGDTTISGDLIVDTNTFFVDASTNRVGINSGTPARTFDIGGSGAGDVVGIKGGNYNQVNIAHSSNSAWGLLIGNSDNTLNSAYHFSTSGNNSSCAIVNMNDDALHFGTNNVERMTIKHDGTVGIGTNNPDSNFGLDVNAAARVRETLTLDSANDNSGVGVRFLGASSYRNFRIGNQLIGNDIFAIQASTANGGTSWNATPAIAIDGGTNRVSINTTTTTVNGINMALNVEGNFNLNGTLYANGSPFVTSKWTDSTTGGHIYRLSRVGVNQADPDYQLHVNGSSNFIGASFGTTTASASNNNNDNAMRVMGDRQYIDTYGVMKANRNTVAENVTVPANTNCMSAGPIELTGNTVVTILDGAAWSII